MHTAGVAELKARLSEYLALVAAGEEVLVMRRGVGVARLVPLQPAAGEDEEMARLRELERQGVLRLGTGKLPEDFWDREMPVVPGNLAVEALLADREESM